MSKILITGGSGFVGKVLTAKLLERGHKIYSLSRHPPAPSENLIPLTGDITLSNLGLKDVPKDIEAVQHLAGIHRLGEDRDGSIWQTNVLGTENVITFCKEYKIPHLLFTSSAYTQGRNTYERSKAFCETMVKESSIPRITIFKPSVVMGTAEHPYPGHFSKFVSAVIQIHRRVELVRRKIEGSLRLPVIEPLFRVRGLPSGLLNLIQVDQVAWAMASIEETGSFWLTHPAPPTLQQLADWVGEATMVRLKFEPEFKPTPIEAQFMEMTSAFAPYLQGDNFPSNLQLAPPITKQFIQETTKRTVLD